ncbi:polyketide synthase [Trichoderma arundinaceum]|uniref:Polyketide synthase n=1 Tax=Trichoderma arundinaceum TaxID=490622 RepID=A0A395NWR9_TRIAR|nr:polyketide synthase [Trichoderma arundinaceum]
MPTFEESVAGIPPHYETTYESFTDQFTDTNRNGNTTSEPVEPIALVGMAMRLPGNVHNADEFWRLLAEKRSGLCEVPKDRFNVEGFQDPSGKPGTFKMSQGYYLQDVDIKQFDTSFFSLSKTELERLDPQQRQLLEVAYECMEDAGATSWRGSNIGCYVGVFGEDWQDLNAKETQHRGGYRVTGYGDFVLANRISYEFDLHGPSMTVKTGCSSSLVGLDLACEAMRKGECDGALICGTSMIFSPTMTLALQDQGVLSPSGVCRSFDAAADGYGRGEAVNAIYVKKLSKALEDGDSIRAIIRGTSVNTDGRTNGMLTPSPTAQAALIRSAYAQAGIRDLSKTAIVECHGTGTSVGDPLETSAVAQCFGDKGMIITSVKPNVGHSEGAAGLTSLIKAVLAIERRQVPPNIYFKTPNPDIPFKRCKLHVPVEVEKWPSGRAERVSVNSFGIGGVNAHVIIESLEEYGKYNPLYSQPSRSRLTARDDTNGSGSDSSSDNGFSTGISNSESGDDTDSTSSEVIVEMEVEVRPQLLLFSSMTETSLNETIDQFKEFVSTTKESLQDVAYTLANRRDHKPHRSYAITGAQSLLEVSPSDAIKSTPTIGWVFTGQGAQWPEMGAELIDRNPVFQKTIRDLDAFLSGLPVPPPWNIEEELRKIAGESRVQKAEFGHPLSIAVQVGLVNVLRSWGIMPDFVLGHSSGEMAAAYASGAITAEAAMAAATFRGTTSTETQSEKRGSMAAIGLGAHEMAPYMETGVVVACENSQCSVTVSGDSEQVEKVVQNVKEQRPGVLARFLKVEKAFHSHHMLEYGPLYEEHLQPYVHSISPPIPFYSSVTGKRLTGDGSLGPAYWRQNMENPVLFNTALRSALAGRDQRVVLIEVGPHPALKGPIGQILRDIQRTEDVHVGTLARDKGQEENLCHLAGKLFQQNLTLDYAAICLPGKHISSLPRYSWKKDAVHFAESRIAKEWRFRKHRPHDLLGVRIIEVSNEPCWRNKLSLQDVPWLTGHEVSGQIVFPGAGYISMIGEAIRQLEGELTYTLTNVSITAGLVLEHDKITELVTKLTPSAVDSSDEVPSYNFSISSYDGNKWIKHCSGEAKASVDKSIDLNAPETVSLSRKVDAAGWYSILKGVGFNYTGLFQGLKGITAAPEKSRSVATVSTAKANADNKYAIHPAIIDQCFQLFTVSAFRGLRRNCRTIAVPTFIEEIIISPTMNDLTVTADILSVERGSFVGDLVAQDGSRVFLSLKGFKATALTSTDSAEDSVPLVTQFEWRPHADFTQLAKYMHPRNDQPKEWALLEELMLLCSLDHLDTIQLKEDAPSHLFKFFQWMQRRVDGYRQGSNTFVSKDLELWSFNRNQRVARIEEIVAEVSKSKWAVFSTAIYRLFETAEALFSGETHALHVLMKDDVLTQFYLVGDSLNYSDAIGAIAHTNPRLRVLEIGAGTGGTTVKILDALKSSYGERMYSSYTYTDISAGFMNAAKERFADYEGIEYAALDITQDPVAQGFKQGGYDLIIGSNVVHATPSLQTSLGNLKSLLSPTGRLFLLELCPDTKFVNYVMGFLSGWWLGAEDDRAEEPFISPERWAKELVLAGFNTPDAIVLDDTAPYHNSAGIIASPTLTSNNPSKVSLLSYSIDGPYVTEVRDNLKSQGIAVDICVFGQPLPSNDVISLLDLQKPLVHEFTETTFKTMVSHLKALNSRLIWATKSSQVACEDPKAAMTLGFARTARSELSVKLFTVEIDNATGPAAAANILSRILLRARIPELDDPSMDPDWEYAVVDGEILVPRLHWKTFSNAFAEKRSEKKDSVKQIDVKTPGLLHTMGWAELESQLPGHGEVVVQTRSIGLNFRDVLIALGVLDNSTREIGLEGCGTVTATGPGVDKLKVGDRVLCVKIDDSMTFEQGAALPCVYATATMALADKANLQPGDGFAQTILIHSACGGVGLAAIQIAQMLGAEVYCTVGNEEKIRYLMENHGIPRSHIFNSRDSSFLLDVMRATNNKGVDVVLNSLSGALLHASWKCVAEFGTMIEIGKRDFRRRAKLSMEAFEKNRTFVGLDLWQVSQERPEKAAALLERCVQWIREGSLKPGAIAKIWEAHQIQEAFRFMQSGRHIGKIIINMPDDTSSLPSIKTAPVPVMRPDRSYLLVGGLGGLGRAVATWMVEQGARHIIFMSRSAKFTPELQNYIRELGSQGCKVQLVAGSVSNMADVERAVNTAAKPIAGVINLSMVLRDISLTEMTYDDWTTAVAPKVQGTWNLHNAISNELDFFILCSSYSGIVGQWGQANYAAANTFLDAFVQYRHSKGLHASVIDIGVMGEVGFVSKNQDIYDLFEKSGLRILKEQDFLDAMNLAIQQSVPTTPRREDGAYSSPGQFLLGMVTTTPIGSPSNRVVWKSDVRMSVYHNINGSTEASAAASANAGKQGGIESLVASAAAKPSILEEDGITTKIANGIASALANFLIKDESSIKIDYSPENVGVDSLVAMELRNWIRQKFGVETNVMTIVQSASLVALGEHIRLGLIERFQSS